MILGLVMWAFIILFGCLFVGILIGAPIGLFCGFMGIEPDGVKEGSLAHRTQGSDKNVIPNDPESK